MEFARNDVILYNLKITLIFIKLQIIFNFKFMNMPLIVFLIIGVLVSISLQDKYCPEYTEERPDKEWCPETYDVLWYCAGNILDSDCQHDE